MDCDKLDKYCKPLILRGGLSEETVYLNCLKYAKILCGNEYPWSELYSDVRRADLHSRIADACDCDCEVVTKAFDEAFPYDYRAHSIDDDFLKKVDRWFDRLKEIADSPRNVRFPSLIPDGPIEVSGIPNMGVEHGQQ